jgi:hypothetical protein
VALVVLAICSITLPTFLVNNLIRAFLYAAVALTVDLLWQSAGCVFRTVETWIGRMRTIMRILSYRKQIAHYDARCGGGGYSHASRSSSNSFADSP